MIRPEQIALLLKPAVDYSLRIRQAFWLGSRWRLSPSRMRSFGLVFICVACPIKAALALPPVALSRIASLSSPGRSLVVPVTLCVRYTEGDRWWEEYCNKPDTVCAPNTTGARRSDGNLSRTMCAWSARKLEEMRRQSEQNAKRFEQKFEQQVHHIEARNAQTELARGQKLLESKDYDAAARAFSSAASNYRVSGQTEKAGMAERSMRLAACRSSLQSDGNSSALWRLNLAKSNCKEFQSELQPELNELQTKIDRVNAQGGGGDKTAVQNPGARPPGPAPQAGNVPIQNQESHHGAVVPARRANPNPVPQGEEIAAQNPESHHGAVVPVRRSNPPAASDGAKVAVAPCSGGMTSNGCAPASSPPPKPPGSVTIGNMPIEGTTNNATGGKTVPTPCQDLHGSAGCQDVPVQLKGPLQKRQLPNPQAGQTSNPVPGVNPLSVPPVIASNNACDPGYSMGLRGCAPCETWTGTELPDDCKAPPPNNAPEVGTPQKTENPLRAQCVVFDRARTADIGLCPNTHERFYRTWVVSKCGRDVEFTYGKQRASTPFPMSVCGYPKDEDLKLVKSPGDPP